MSDLISRQAAILAIEEYADRLQMVNWKENPGVPYKAHTLNWAINTLRELPSAERHGRWKHTRDLYSCPDGNQLFYGKICSVCNNVSPYETPYCMNCGAKMDEGCTPLVADPILTRQTND